MKTASANKNARIVAWIIQIVLALGFLFMGALPKLTGDPMSQALFEKIGFAPGMYIVGGLELITAILLLVPKLHAIGASLGALLMIGAIGTHLGPLGLQSTLIIDGEQQSNPALFFMAIGFLVLNLMVVVLRRDELPGISRGAGASEAPPAGESV